MKIPQGIKKSGYEFLIISKHLFIGLMLACSVVWLISQRMGMSIPEICSFKENLSVTTFFDYIMITSFLSFLLYPAENADREIELHHFRTGDHDDYYGEKKISRFKLLSSRFSGK